MTARNHFDIFLAAVSGLEEALCAEARAKGFRKARTVVRGVGIKGGWPDVWRANLALRGASRVLARIDTFPASHLTHLERRAPRIPWASFLRPDRPFRVEATCRKSRIYHSGAAAERIERAISASLGAGATKDADVVIKVRIENDLCTVAVDTSGEPLHRRGHKEEVAKAPMRETMAALFLYQCGYAGDEPVLDPMCGSGTFVIEAAEIAAGLAPGRSRNFAFEQLATFEPEAWDAMRKRHQPAASRPPPAHRFLGSDRDAGAIRMSIANAERAGVSAITDFRQLAVSEVTAPEGPPGLVIVNPPYGDRIGDSRKLQPLYRALGQTLLTRFTGWRVGIVTSDSRLAETTGLPFLPPGPPVSHGGIRIQLHRTGPLP